MEIHEGKQLQNFAKVHKLGISGLSEKLGYKERAGLYFYFKKERLDDDFKKKVLGILNVPATDIWPQSEMPTHTTGDQIRQQKAFGDKEDEGLIYVPVTAQAGYAKHIAEPVFLHQLKRWKIPDFPFKGDKYRIFEVEGDSMTYTDEEGRIRGLLNGYQVIGERVEAEDWKYSTQWYIHVLVFEDFLTIKRVYRDDANNTFVLISDNPGYPQRRYSMSDVKELWIMKRYMGYDMSPPIKYEITV